MNRQDRAPAPDFWSPEFDYERRDDGTVLMRQTGELEDDRPLVADYLDRWAEEAPDRTWLARRQDGGDWRRISYAQARRAARSIGAALLELGLGPDRPLMILSENSLEHALLGVACTCAGIPYAPVSPAYSLMSQDHGKIRDIARTLNPGAVFADDGGAFADALAAIGAEGRAVINHRNRVGGAIPFDDLLDADPDAADAARAALTPDTVVKYLFTSGSTGSPKAVINTNRMICASQAMVRDCYRYLRRQPPVVLDWAPWNHTAAGNTLAGEAVVSDMHEAFVDADGPLAERLLTALTAGEAAGGDKRGDNLSAAVLVHAPEPNLSHNMRVDQPGDPIDGLWDAYEVAMEHTEAVDDPEEMAAEWGEGFDESIVDFQMKY